MKDPVIKYIIFTKDEKEIQPIKHNTKVIPRKGEKLNDVSGTFVVEDIIHAGIFGVSENHTITVIMKEI